MPQVRWIMLYGFCTKFHTLSSSAKILNIGWDLTKLQAVKRWELFLRHSVVAVSKGFESILDYLSFSPCFSCNKHGIGRSFSWFEDRKLLVINFCVFPDPFLKHVFCNIYYCMLLCSSQTSLGPFPLSTGNSTLYSRSCVYCSVIDLFAGVQRRTVVTLFVYTITMLGRSHAIVDIHFGK